MVLLQTSSILEGYYLPYAPEGCSIVGGIKYISVVGINLNNFRVGFLINWMYG